MRKLVLMLSLAALIAHPALAAETTSKEPIKIGILLSLTGLALPSQTFQNGAELAADVANGADGLLGRPVKLVIRDDKNDPAKAVLEAEKLTLDENVPILIGGILDNVSSAISAYAKNAQIPYIKPTGGSERFLWQNGHRYSFMTDLSTDTLAALLAREAAKGKAKRWVLLAPNYEYGHIMYEAFRRHLEKLTPDATWVLEQFIEYNKIDAGSVVNIVNKAKPDAVLALIFYNDLVRFNREANRRGLFKNTLFVSPYLGWPDSLEMFGKEAPIGWISQGFPYMSIKQPDMQRFVRLYQEKYGKPPGANALDGYIATQFAIAAIRKAGKLDREAITDALSGIDIGSPMGTLHMRPQDHQSTMGGWIGKTGFIGETPTILDWYYAEPIFPSDAFIKTVRPPS